MFGKNKKTESAEYSLPRGASTRTRGEQERRPTYAEAWGAYAAAARFRGLMLLIVSVCCALISAALVLSLAVHRPVVVALDAGGRPDVLEATQLRVNRDIFVREFLDSLYSYMPLNVDDKAAVATRMMTPKLAHAWTMRMGDEWTRLVKANDVLQVMGVRTIELSDLTESGFTATATVELVRTERRLGNNSVKEGTVQLVVVEGEITARNPWGLYVDVLRDETREPQRRS